MGNVWFAFGLSLFAGLATGLGSIIALARRRPGPRFLGASLGLSAGVMIYVSLVELLPQARGLVSGAVGASLAGWVAIGAFFIGVLIVGVIDRLIPSEINPHEPVDSEAYQRAMLMRTGMMTALALAIHNFPEGFATFMAALTDPQIGFPVAVAVAIHNVPEGVAVAVPVYQATGSRSRALLYSFGSGLAEPAGAVIGYLVLAPFLSDLVTGLTFSVIAGIMVFISVDELLPSAHEFGDHHSAVYGVMAGMAIMGASLLLLG